MAAQDNAKEFELEYDDAEVEGSEQHAKVCALAFLNVIKPVASHSTERRHATDSTLSSHHLTVVDNLNPLQEWHIYSQIDLHEEA